MARELVRVISKLLNGREHEAEIIIIRAYEALEQKKISRSELYFGALEITPEVEKLSLKWVTRRASGEPLQYIIGKEQFLEHDYYVERGVLIPRQETELLVTIAIEKLRPKNPQIGVEIGIGSGIISIELLCAFSKLSMVASDVSERALSVAKKNASSILGADYSARFSLIKANNGEVFTNFPKADFLISNPPYMDRNDEIAYDVLKHEPREALFSFNDDPLYFYKEIAAKASHFLKNEGLVFLEISEKRAREVRELFENNDWNIELIKDLTGRDRIAVASAQS